MKDFLYKPVIHNLHQVCGVPACSTTRPLDVRLDYILFQAWASLASPLCNHLKSHYFTYTDSLQCQMKFPDGSFNSLLRGHGHTQNVAKSNIKIQRNLQACCSH